MDCFPNAWHAVVDHLGAAGVTVLFGLPGDDLALLPALDAGGPRLVLCRDQRNAVFMATGYAVQSGAPGVCVLGKGPAVANAVTGLAEARSGSAPLVVLSGGIPAEHRGSGAFQELDHLGMVAPVVKWAHRVDHPSRVLPALEKAFLVARSGAPGPVYLEIPDDLGAIEVPARPWSPPPVLARSVPPREDGALDAVRAAERPVVLVGGGMRHRAADGVVERFADALGAAVVCTASGRGAVLEDHPSFCGLSGLYAPAAMAPLWETTDLVIAVGSRLEETATFGWRPHLPVVQVNRDAAELSTEHAGARIVGDGADVLGRWTGAVADRPPNADWRAAIHRCREDLHAGAEAEFARMRADPRLHVAEVLAAIDAVVPPSRVLVQENGLQDMWSYAFPYHVCRSRGGSVVPSEQTSLGFGAAAAAGVRLAAPDRPVIAFVGDGAYTLFRSDVDTVRREGIGVVYVVLCNGGYGWLHAQRAGRGLDARRYPFAADPPPGGPVITDRARLEDALREAVVTSERRGVATVHVAVELTDTPPGIDEPDGDFAAAAGGTGHADQR
ncbi:thiamine pyrophosphate-binding protein [Saccharopolyspora sp. CA-218241]|uniref:thiamine pyrophosphate-binding protein n=1 Tax=Saccharopolyspora sp. CA-218241 TaxID=3240027 RepID=UPI003D994E61